MAACAGPLTNILGNKNAPLEMIWAQCCFKFSSINKFVIHTKNAGCTRNNFKLKFAGKKICFKEK